MGLMKKLRLKGAKPPNCCSTGCRVRQKPIQLDFFEGDFFYHETRMLYVSPKKDVEESK